MILQRFSITRNAGSLCKILSGVYFSTQHLRRSQGTLRRQVIQRVYQVSSSCKTMASSSTQDNKLVVLDVDCGQDDAQAIMLALTRPNVQVLGITCVSGNVGVHQVCRNVLRILKVFGRLDVPVYRGADVPILGTHMDCSHWHGQDGLGDVPDPDPPSLELVQSEHAVTALLRLSKEHPGEISLVAMAPLTNLALAVRMDPEFPARLRELVIMGGNINARGRVTPTAEFNFAYDSEAAHMVLSGYPCPVSDIPYEVCRFSPDCGIPWDEWDKIMAIPTERGKFHSAILAASTAREKAAKTHTPLYHTCDPYALMVAARPDIVMETEDVYATVELRGEVTRGQMVCDYRGLWKKEPNLRVVKKLDMKAAIQMFWDALQ
ncbi:Hypp816 [Branchiostoma lanceolatum]|uniref:Hypp816 protein n=1 Tax=Branchiostoma lanceolatum TaxID=7740 RepID=A0A8J9VBW3_BRALA|nr:Hypp816 [Branchiostoma lanceolatum]